MESKNPVSDLFKIPISFFPPSSPDNISSFMAVKSIAFFNARFLKKFLSVLSIIVVVSASLLGQVDGDYQTINTGNWSNIAIWEFRSGGACIASTDYPGQNPGAGTVYIQSNHTITLDLSPVNPLGALTFATGNTDPSSVVFGSNWILNISGAITYSIPGGPNDNQTINVATGSLNCASITMVNTGINNRDNILNLSSGTINVSGNITMVTNLQNAINVTTGIINIGGDFIPGTGNFTAGTGLVNYYGVIQSVAALTYYNLTTSNSGIKTIANADAIVGGYLDVSNSTLAFTSTAARILTVTGNLSGNGTIDLSPGSRP